MAKGRNLKAMPNSQRAEPASRIGLHGASKGTGKRSPNSPLIASVSGDNSRQLGETVADTIVNAVAQGILAPGQRIVEAELAAQLDVSRVPIREAIKILQAQGIVNVTPNRGARVATFDQSMVDQVYVVRVALEQVAAREAMRAYAQEPRALDELREIVSRMERVARWSDWGEFRRCDVLFHHEFCRASGNEILLKLWEALARYITIIFGRELASERNFEVVITQHRHLIAAFEAQSPDIAQMIEDHILRLRRQPSITNGIDNAKTPRPRR